MANLSRTKLTAGSLVLLASTTASMALPDVVLCELYSLSQFGTSGSVRALALATTSWNIGDSDLPWMQNPDPQHPVIGMNMYRLDNDRFEQIGVSWLKHGFFALGDLQCDDSGLPNCVYESGHGIGDYLGQGCTDTYSASLNAGGLGPRFEINPWTGAFNYNTSMFNTGGLPGNNTRRLRVEDADMNPAINPNADYFFEGYYVHFQDRNHMNSAAWKPCTPVRSGTGNYSFTQSNFNVIPTWGFAIDAWTGASQTIVAQQIPVVEGTSPDGRCILAYKVTDNGNGTWHYEYAIMNVDMDRQIDEFIIPVPAGVNITNIGFHAPAHTEPRAYVNGPVIDNAQWNGVVSGGEIRWSTTTNPLRWGSLYNFRFDADTAPTNVDAEFSRFKTGQAGDLPLFGATQGPSAPTPSCAGDINNSGAIDVDDLNQILSAFGDNVGIGDPRDIANNDGIVDVDDLNVVLAAFGDAC
ncbi:MAG: hypothetical protein H6812_04220 [Phycisphaeraceae bacterium]|nr:hypothetical protein [Phycisphaerales bacterium]MCB9842443.1 hypothetical protein [Phycisphaeraceae bacterium]